MVLLSDIKQGKRRGPKQSHYEHGLFNLENYGYRKDRVHH
jgi:hypothetical protein